MIVILTSSRKHEKYKFSALNDIKIIPTECVSPEAPSLTFSAFASVLYCTFYYIISFHLAKHCKHF